MLSFFPVTSCNGQVPLNPTACVDALCTTYVIHWNPQYQSFLGTILINIVHNHCLCTSRIIPSDGFQFGLSGSVLVNDISLLRQHFMKSVTGLFRYFDPSNVISSEAPSSITDLVQLKTSTSLSFSSIQRNSFIYRRNRTNLQ